MHLLSNALSFLLLAFNKRYQPEIFLLRSERAQCFPVQLLPLTVSKMAGVPAVALDGLKLLIAGTGLAGTGLMVNTAAVDVPPPGAGLTTVTLAVPAAAMSAAKIAAVTRVAETKLVVRTAPFQFTVELLTKLLPLTVSVVAAPPAVALDGLKLLIAGTGLLMVNVAALDVPPPGEGLNTLTWAAAAVAISPARMEAKS